MAIEFSCPHCQHLLRTSDDKAGLSAKCPACSEIIYVPHQSEAGATESPAASESPQEIGIPLRRDPEPSPPDGTAPAEAGASPGIPRRRPGADIECPNCHATNEATASHCRYCGTSLEGVEPVQQSESAAIARTPEVGETLETAWRVYSGNLGLLVGTTLLAIPLGLLVLAVAALPTLALVAAFANADGDMAPVGLGIGLICSMPLLLLLGVPLSIGITRLNLNVAQGRPAQVSDLFYGFDPEGRKLLPGMTLVMLVAMVAQAVIFGTILIWPLAFMLVHQRQPIGDTFTKFLNALGNQFVFVLLIGLIIYGVSVVAGILTYPCCIGILLLPFVIPFTNVLMAVGYLRFAGERTAVD